MRKSAIAGLLWIALSAGSAMASSQPERPPAPVVMVHFDYYPKDTARIHALERQLASAIKKAHAGELGETEFHVDGNDGYLYMFGPDSDRLYSVTGPILRSSRLMTDALNLSSSRIVMVIRSVAAIWASSTGNTAAG